MGTLTTAFVLGRIHTITLHCRSDEGRFTAYFEVIEVIDEPKLIFTSEVCNSSERCLINILNWISDNVQTATLIDVEPERTYEDLSDNEKFGSHWKRKREEGIE